MCCKDSIPLPAAARGFSLLEILITIVVLAIAASSIMGVYINVVQKSADPVIQQQAIAIAEAYLEEIQLKQFCEDPPLCVAETGSSEGAESRGIFNDIQDYNALADTVVRDQSNTAIAALSNYSVQVNVAGQALNGAATIAASDSMRIDVTIDHPGIDPITLSGFRTNY